MNKGKMSGIKAAVVGAGRMGRRHIQAVQELGMQIVGVCDKEPKCLELASEERGLQKSVLFSDSRSMFETVAPECVIVATTTDSHHHFACEAARRGAKYILCEKPMASSVAQCDEIIDLCRQNGVKLAV